MGPELIRLAEAHLSPAFVQRAGALVGESSTSTHKALEAAIPAMVTGLAGEASSASGARRVMEVIEEGGLRDGATTVHDRLAKGRGAEVIEGGKALLARLFPGRVSSMVDALARSTGVGASSMSSLLALAAPLVLGTVGREVQVRGLDVDGLSAMLRSPPPSAGAAAIPEGGARVARARTEQPDRREGAASGAGRFWPLLLLIPLAIAGAFWLRNKADAPPRVDVPAAPPRLGAGLPSAPPEAAPLASPPPPLPADTVPPLAGVPEGTIAFEMHEYLASGGTEGVKRWVIDDLTFAPASAALPGRSIPTLDALATVMKAHPEARLLVEGHTDDSGPPGGNARLSEARASAVKSALVGRGVGAERVDVAGIGADRPIASNDTPEGRAKNRRTEVILTPR